MGLGSKLSGLAKQVGTAFGNVIAPGSIAATQIADGSVTTPKIANGALSADATGRAKMANGFVTDAQVATANKDGASATASLRTLGTGAAQACAGNDARLSDTRTPTDGSVTAAKLAQMSATTGQVLQWGGSAWAPATLPSAPGSWTDVASSRAVDGTTYTNTDGKDREILVKLVWGWTGVASGGGLVLDGVNAWAPSAGASETLSLCFRVKAGGTYKVDPGSPAWSITKSKWLERAA